MPLVGFLPPDDVGATRIFQLVTARYERESILLTSNKSLSNPVYAGIIRYNRFEGWSEKRRRGKNSKPILAEGKHEAIVQRDLWEEAQALFCQRSKENPRAYDGVSLQGGPSWRTN